MIKLHLFNANKILVIDPIFRASRLIYSWIISSGANQRNFVVDILTRTEAKTDQYFQLFRDINHNLYEEIKLPRDFWYGKIPNDQIIHTINKITQIEYGEYTFVFFTGLNEYLPFLLQNLNKYRPQLSGVKIRMVDYDASYLLTKKNANLSPKQSFVKTINFFSKHIYIKNKYSKYELIETSLRNFTDLKFFLLDERPFNDEMSGINKLGKDRFIYLPDPNPNIVIQRKLFKGDKITILIVGLQSKRKGISDIINLIENFDIHYDRIRFLLAGRFDDETIYLKKRINKLSDRIELHEGYFSEEEIQKYYQEADYVILPYDTTFSGSSGVMAYATTFGKPMITTDHGCIGYRTNNFRLGFTYQSGILSHLEKILQKLPRSNTDEYRKLSNNCLKFSSNRTANEFQRIIFEDDNN